MATQWIKADAAIWEELNGEVVVVEPRSGRTWLLNTAAAQIWQACDGRLRRFDAESAAFCRQLASAGLVAATETTSGRALCFSGLPGPSLCAQGLGTGPRHRPSPRGLSGPG